MASISWKGANGNWNTAANWSSNTVPGAGDDAVLGSSGAISITVPISVHSIANTGARLSVTNLGGTASIASTYVNGGELHVDDGGGQGGSMLSIGGLLTNTNYLAIGNGGATGSSTVTAAALSNTGTINLGSSGANLATLNIAGAAGFGTAGILTGTISLAGNALLEFGSGQITTIAGQLVLDGTKALLADASDTTHNSALAGLNTITGRLYLRNGASVAPSGNLAINGGELHVDDGGGQGGTTLAIPGTLTNTNYLAIGNGGASGSTTVTAAALSNTGTLNLGSNGSNLATLSIAGAAGFGSAGTLTGTVNLASHALLAFGSGQITKIAGQLVLDGTNAFLADTNDTTHNSALAGLNTITGRLYLRNGASISPGGNLTINGGELHVDDGGGQGGTMLAIPGTLTNTNYLAIGNGGASASTTVSAAALSNTGTINLGSNTPNLATLNIAGAAGFGSTGTLTGAVNLGGNALLEFGSGQITTIAGQLVLDGTHAFVADANDTTHNSALSGLNTITGRLYLRNGASVAPSGNLAINGGELHVDDGGGQGGTTLAIPGTLTNTNYLAIGNGGASGSTTVTAATFFNTGTLNLGSNIPNLATLNIAGAAGFGTVGTLTGTVNLAGNALLEFGSGKIGTIAGQLVIDGTNAFLADANDTTHNSALTGLNTITGRLYLRNGASVSPSGDLAINGGELHVDDGGGQGGTTLAIPGTLTNTSYLAIGNGGASASTTVSAAALSNTGTINLGSNTPNLATLNIAGAAGLGTAGTLTGTVNLAGNALLEFGSGKIGTIAGQLVIDGTNAFVADANDTTHNSALTGLNTITGRLYLRNGASVSPTGNLAINGGELHVDDGGGQGGTSLVVPGTLTNTNYLAIGNGSASGSTTVTAAGLVNSGTINLGSNTPNLATLTVNGIATNTGQMNIASSANLVVGAGKAFAQNAGTTLLSATLTGDVDVNGGIFDGSGTVTGNIDINGGPLLAGRTSNTPATLTVQGNLVENSKGTIEVPVLGTSAGQVGSITVGGTVDLEGGTLQIDANNVTFAVGQTFTIMTFAPGALTGTFDAVKLNGSVGSPGGVEIGGNLALAVDYDNAAGDIQLVVVYEPYLTFYKAAATFGPDLANGASASQIVADATSTQAAAVSGALGALGGQTWQQAYDNVSPTLATLAGHLASNASATQILQDTAALDARLVAGLLGSIAGGGSAQAYADVLQAANTLVGHIAGAAGDAQIQADMTALYGKLAGGIVGSPAWQQAIAAGTAAAHSLATDQANHAGASTIQADVASLFGTIVSGSLTALGGSAWQLAYANGGTTMATLGSDIAAGASAAKIHADVDGLFASIAPAVAGSAAGTAALNSFHTVTNAASQIGADLLSNAASNLQLLSDQIQLLGAVAGARIGDAAGSEAEQAFDQIIAGIGSLQADFLKSAGPNVLAADAKAFAASASVITMNALGPTGLGTASSAATTAADALSADLETLRLATAGGAAAAPELQAKVAADQAKFSQALSNLTTLALNGGRSGAPAESLSAESAAPALSPHSAEHSLDNAYKWPADPQQIIGTDQPAPELTHPNLEQVGNYLRGLDDIIRTDQQTLVNAQNNGQWGEVSRLSDRLQQEISNQTYWGQYYAAGAAGGKEHAKQFQKLDADIRHGNWKDVPKDMWDYYTGWKDFFKDPLKKLEDLAKKYDLNEFWNWFKDLGHAHGDVHLVTYDGLHYDFQGVGEFTLSKSTMAGDSFNVQVRLEPWFGSGTVSVMTQVAASVGSDRVTFDLHRADTVWVNGHATSLSEANPTLYFGAGQLVELSPTQFELTWNSGEVLTVSNNGSFLGVDTAVGSGPHSVQGLLGTAAGQSTTFTLPDGTVLSQPLSSQQLYTAFGNAWRVTQQNSLFDYNAGQTTATFTNLNFPQGLASLQNLPLTALNEAGNAVFAAGITDPNIANDAALDFIATGDSAFVTAAAHVDRQVVVTTATNPTGAAAGPVLGVAAVQSSQEAIPGGETIVAFNVYLTGSLATATNVTWSVVTPGVDFVPASAFGGALPSGQVTIAAGQTQAQFSVHLPSNALGAMAIETLGVGIGTVGGPAIFAQTARTMITQPFGIASITATTPWDTTHVGAGDIVTLRLQMSATTFVTGTPTLQLNDNAVATYTGGSGSTTLTFSYVVRPGDQTSDLQVTGLTLGTADALKDDSGASLAGFVAADLGIAVDSQTKVNVQASSAVKVEGNSGATPFTFVVTQYGDTSAAHSVAWAVTGAGANPAAASDFAGGVLPSGMLNFTPGETAKVLTVNIAGDAAAEADEGFVVTLSNPSPGLALGTATATGTIQNDDSAAVTVATHDDAYVVQQGQSLSIAASVGVLLNDQSASTAALLSGPTHGTFQFAANGGFTYAPAAGFTGIDSFAYHAATGASGADGQALLYVVPVNVGTSTTLNLLALNAEEQIAATYAAFFGRAADAAGFEFWVGEFNRGLPVQGAAALFANIASSFGISAEAKALYPFLVNPFGASDAQISSFLDSVYNNLFNRGSDAPGLAYWTGQIKATLAAGQFVGSVLVNIMSGAQDTAAGKDITALMGKVAVSLAYVHEQEEHHTAWSNASDTPAATNLLHAVASDATSVLTGVKNAEMLIANHP